MKPMSTDDIAEEIMPFGKHEGEMIGDVPLSYLDWLVSQEWFAGKFCRLHEQITAYLKDPAIEKLLNEELGE